jgi:hypothetical protein
MVREVEASAFFSWFLLVLASLVDQLMVQVMNAFDLMCGGVLCEMGAMWCGGADARARKCADADGEPVPSGERSPGEHVRRGLLAPARAHRRAAPSQHVLPLPPDAWTPPPRQSAREAGGDILRDRPGAQELRPDRRGRHAPGPDRLEVRGRPRH